MRVYLSSEHIEEPAVEVKDIRTLVVKDEHGNPIIIAIQQTQDHIWYVTPDDPKFPEVMKTLGLDKRFTVQRG